MSGFDPQETARLVADHGAVVRVLVARVAGSAPREVGAAMTVHPGGHTGTIGGGALEHMATGQARRMLGDAGPWARALRRQALGPGLGQCCGGGVTLFFERFGPAEVAALDAPEPAAFARPLTSGAPGRLIPGAAPRLILDERADQVTEPLAAPGTPLFLYGAGHVGRAVAHVLRDLPYDLFWVDDAPDRFPTPPPPFAHMMVAERMEDAAATAPAGAVHMVMTYSHDTDLKICHRVLSLGRFFRLGVIGSATKAAKFRARLAGLGHPPERIARMECPIGAPGLGDKTPGQIAISLAADLIARQGAAERSLAV